MKNIPKWFTIIIVLYSFSSIILKHQQANTAAKAAHKAQK